ncbi:MAG: VCBS repeat-containing protein [Myxococcales bacterium]|nr:VCBS repeat-containing protein [Myxococcales bacterium]
MPLRSSTPSSLVTGFFDGDVVPDIAVANQGTASVSVFLNSKLGLAFVPGPGTPCSIVPNVGIGGGAPIALARGSFGNPKVADVATANNLGAKQLVSALFGAGQGTVTAADTGVWSGAINGVGIGDLDGDGTGDIAGALSAGSGIHIKRKPIAGDFISWQTVGMPQGNLPIANTLLVSDLNADNLLDLVVGTTNAGGFATALQVADMLLLNTAHPVGFPVVGLTVAALDGDKALEVVVVGGKNIAVSLKYGTGNLIAFATGVDLTSVVAVNLNKDGKLDLVVTDRAANTVIPLLGDGQGLFTPLPAQQQLVGAGPIHIATADFNQDGRGDLVVANLGGNSVTVLLNTTLP